MVISEICCNFIVLKYKEIQTKIAMITEDKVTEIYCMADDFCKVFDAQMKKYTIRPQNKRKYHRNSTYIRQQISWLPQSVILKRAAGSSSYQGLQQVTDIHLTAPSLGNGV